MATRQFLIANPRTSWRLYVTALAFLSGKSQAVELLLQSADEALYRAKNNGRNRFVLAVEEEK